MAIKNTQLGFFYDEDRFAHTEAFFKNAKTLTGYEINLFQILSLFLSLYFTFKCKNRTTTIAFS